MITDPERRRQYFKKYMREYRKNKPVKPILKFKEVKPRRHFSKEIERYAERAEISSTQYFMTQYARQNIAEAMKKLDGGDHDAEIKEISYKFAFGQYEGILKTYHWYRLAHCEPETVYGVILLLQKALKDNDIQSIKTVRDLLRKGVEYTDSVIRIAQNETEKEAQ